MAASSSVLSDPPIKSIGTRTMVTGIPDPHQIRQYLLGRLDENDELENTVSERILYQNDAAELADLIEDDMIEEYLDGTLDTADRHDFEKYFLQPAERKERLLLAKLLRDRFQSTPEHGVSRRPELNALPSTDFATAGGALPQSVPHYSFLRTYGQLAALALICIVSAIYIFSLQKNQGRLEASLVQERDRSVALENQSELLQSRTPPLYLVSDSARSAGGQIPYVEIKPSTELAVIDLALRSKASGNIYDVVLQKTGGMEPIWAAKLPGVTSPSGDARLVFDLPVQGIEPGRYSLKVSPAGSESSDRYEFEIRVTH